MSSLICAAKTKVISPQTKIKHGRVALLPEFAAEGEPEADTVVFLPWAHDVLWLDLQLRISGSLLELCVEQMHYPKATCHEPRALCTRG